MRKGRILDTLKEALVRDLRLEDITPADIDPCLPLFGDSGLGLDSLDAVELVVLVEKHFGVSIADAEEAGAVFTSLDVLADFIVAKGSNA
ncbi:MAG: phosphopantetheine-binding protein [Desulfovibrio sp.]|jgi:acyl carrier protein|nr:phosphopantetheine-binding protein [Desulfovibrio sp.]